MGYFNARNLSGDAVVDYVALLGVISGLAAASYWYPLALIKTVKVTDAERDIGYATAVPSILTILGVVLCNRLLYVLFFILSISLPCVTHTVHTIWLFREVADGGQAAPYRGEYFAVLETFLAAGRILGCALLIPVAVSGNVVAMDIVTWMLVIFLGVFSIVTNRYE